MIPRSVPGVQTSWQELYADVVTDPAELVRLLDLPTDSLPAIRQAARLFGLRIPRSYVQRMPRGNPDNPLLRQYLPTHYELQIQDGYTSDPVGDMQALRSPGLLQKYHGRALLVMTGACAVHCRYCFRRHFPYGDNAPLHADWERALDHIRQDDSISEIILSGGDPLSLSDRRIESVISQLDAIPHIQRLRIHTRLPVIIPQRITPDLVRIVSGMRLKLIVVLHVNHADEIDVPLGNAVNKLHMAGGTLLNQSVLLRGINDESTVLAQLSEQLFHIGVMPYYLHVLDKVQGASHFDLPMSRIKIIMNELRVLLPGYLVPRVVREESGAKSKLALADSDHKT